MTVVTVMSQQQEAAIAPRASLIAFRPWLLSAMLIWAWGAAAAAPLQFWNLTSTTLTGVELAPAGSGQFGPNQCANDPDGAVDHDERLKLVGIQPGSYDVRVTRKSGRVCTVHDVTVKAGGHYAFSLTDKDMTDMPQLTATHAAGAGYCPPPQPVAQKKPIAFGL